MKFQWGKKTKLPEPEPDKKPPTDNFAWVRYLDSFRKNGLSVAILIDGNSIFCREYHAHPSLRSSDGTATGALYGWAQALIDFVCLAKPTLAAIAWDGKRGERAPNFRKAIFPGYKAGRKRDEALEEQLNSPVRFALTELLGIPQFGDGYQVPEEEGIAEADDILATLARKLIRSKDADVVAVISGDRDMLQLMGDGDEEIHVMTPKSGISVLDLWTAESTRKKFGVYPGSLRVYKAIVGDTSDAIPGVSGLGEKKFEKIMELAGDNGSITLEQVFASTGKYPGTIGRLLEEHIEDAAMFHELVKLRDDVELPDPLPSLECAPPDWKNFYELCKLLEFRSLLPGASEPREEYDPDERPL